MRLEKIRQEIISDKDNRIFLKKKWGPIYTANPSATILIIGQAPSKLAQESGIPWNDQSGDNLRTWLGVTRNEFYDKTKIALVPVDFYFPGSKERGDVPPRKGFAEKWHPLILEQLPDIKLTILIGQYSQELYLGTKRKESLTKTVQAYGEFLPKYMPLVHPSPRNNIWQKKNPWFKKDVLPKLQSIVRNALRR